MVGAEAIAASSSDSASLAVESGVARGFSPPSGARALEAAAGRVALPPTVRIAVLRSCGLSGVGDAAPSPPVGRLRLMVA